MGGDWRAPPSPWGGAGRSSRHDSSWISRPPIPPGSTHCSVHLWEKKFVTVGCRISWKRFYESKLIINRESSVFKWDDSAALDAFQNAKARFQAHYFGYPCDIPLPDPYMYIDQVDYDSFVDPELVADLEISTVPSFRINAEVLVRNVNNNTSGNWDDLIDKAVQVNNTWGNAAATNLSSWRVGDWSNNRCHGGEGAAAWGNGVLEDATWSSRRFNYDNRSIRMPSNNKDWRDREGASALGGVEGTASAWANGVMEDASWSSRRFYYENRGRSTSSKNKDWCGVEGTAAYGIGEGNASWGNEVLEDAYWSSKRFNYENDSSTTMLKNEDRVSYRIHGRKRHGGVWLDSRFTRTKY